MSTYPRARRLLGTRSDNRDLASGGSAPRWRVLFMLLSAGAGYSHSAKNDRAHRRALRRRLAEKEIVRYDPW